MKPIKMVITIIIPNREYDINSLRASIGPFQFKFMDRILEFNFDQWESEFVNAGNDIILKFSSGRGYFDCPGISKKYESEMRDNGFYPVDVTARFLSDVDEIVSFQSEIESTIFEKSGAISENSHVPYPYEANTIKIKDTPHILNIKFINDFCKLYQVDPYVIGNYNLRVDEGIKWREENGTKC